MSADRLFQVLDIRGEKVGENILCPLNCTLYKYAFIKKGNRQI